MKIAAVGVILTSVYFQLLFCNTLFSAVFVTHADASEDLIILVVTNWPDVWTAQAALEKQNLYPWLIANDGLLGCKYCRDAPIPKLERAPGSIPSQEWISCKVGFTHDEHRTKKTKLTMLRNKISQHRKSAAHMASSVVYERKKALSETEQLLAESYTKYQSSTERVFRVAYNIAKMNRPYTDLPDHVDCYKCNGVEMGHILHSDKSCAAIINSIASDMRAKLMKNVVDSDSKVSVLVDESTTLSGKSTLVVHVRSCIGNRPTTFFVDLVQLASTDAKSIIGALLKSLASFGFDHEYLSRNFICFASDGASVMTGVSSGVGSQLLKMFPNLLLWHCLNHRLELAVGDSITEVSGTSPFKIFIDNLYSLYNQSPKLQEELRQCATCVNGELKKIGRVLDTRWAASSLRTVKAVWSSFEVLVHHFKSKQEGKDASKYKGLVNTLTSPTFVLNLGIMYDALEEIAHLSVLLQRRDMSLVTSHRLIGQTIKAMEGMAEQPGAKLKYAMDAVEERLFKGIELSTTKTASIHSGQFFRSLATSLQSRMLTVSSRKGEKLSTAIQNSTEYTQLMNQVSLLNSSTWPTNYEEIPRFGEQEVVKLCERLNIDSTDVVRDFKLLKAVGGRDCSSPGIDTIKMAISCIPVSTAECERAFSLMNTIITPKRNRLEIANVSSLMFANVLGPPITMFNPTEYVRNWLRRGNHASSDTQSVKRSVKDPNDQYYAHVYKLL
jgi:hypothetical protein